MQMCKKRLGKSLFTWWVNLRSGLPNIRARPKSASLSCPVGPINKLFGFISLSRKSDNITLSVLVSSSKRCWEREKIMWVILTYARPISYGRKQVLLKSSEGRTWYQQVKGQYFDREWQPQDLSPWTQKRGADSPYEGRHQSTR